MELFNTYIDMALYLVGEIAGSEEAQAIQLMIEYDLERRAPIIRPSLARFLVLACPFRAADCFSFFLMPET